MQVDIAHGAGGQQSGSRWALSRLLVGLGLLGLLAFVGYWAFVAFATLGPTFAARGYLIIAMVAGAGAFFSPCAFPFLPSYFTYSRDVQGGFGRVHRRLASLANGAVAAAGVLTFNAILGLVFGMAGLGVARSLVLLSPTPSTVAVTLRVIVGVAFAGLGTVQVSNLSFHGALPGRIARYVQPGDRRRGPFLGQFLYGFAYTLVGIGCTAPFLATVIVLSLASGGLLQGMAGFLVFSLTMAGLMVTVSAVASSSRRRLLRNLGESTPKIKRAGGAVIAGFGALLILLSLLPGILRPLFP